MSVAPLVLAIDDEPGILRLITIELSAQGLRVITAQSGDEGVRMGRNHGPTSCCSTSRCRTVMATR